MFLAQLPVVLRLVPPDLLRSLGARARGDAQFLTGIRQPRRGADQRLCRLWLASSAGHGGGGGAHDGADAVHAARQPLRHVGLSRRTARNVGRCPTIAAHLSARLNAGLRQIAFFIVPSAMAFLALRRRDHRGRCFNGRVHRPGLDIRLGHSGGLGGGAARADAGAAVFLDLLCPPRHAHATAFRRRSRGADDRLGYLCAIPLPPGSASTRGGASRD